MGRKRRPAAPSCRHYGVGGFESTTVTVAPRETVPEVAVTVAAPTATPVTRPALLTEATLLFELAQDTLPGTSVPALLTNVAIS